MEPASKTLAMAGWSIRAKAWRSDSKRAMTSRVFIPAFTSFRATPAAHRFPLFGQPHLAYAAFSEFFRAGDTGRWLRRQLLPDQ